jgi:hypothetical protein
MIDRYRLNASDRAAITEAHATGAARGLFGELEFVSHEGTDLAVIRDVDSKVALLVTPQTMDGIYLLTRAWNILQEGDKFAAVADTTRKAARKPRAAKSGA